MASTSNRTLNKAVPGSQPAEVQTMTPQTAAPQTTVIVNPTPVNDSAAAAQAQPVVEGNVLTQNPPQKLPPLTPGESDIFGQKFFHSSAKDFIPSPSIDDKQYILGAGDVLMISLWGQIQSAQEVTVDNNGRITLSTVGPVLVSGYTIQDAKKKILIALSRSYSGLVSQPPTIFMDLSLSKLRPVRVFIMGEVSNPGGYFVNNFASVFNSLFVVGGPKPSGSFRDVRVIRNNKTIAHVDLYDYLFGSPKMDDLRINDNDIIFVPLKGRSVRIQGEVLRPFTYELLPGENLKKLIEFSGGVRSTMYRDRALVDRIVPFSERVKDEYDRKVFDINFKDIVDGKKDYTMQDGDVVTIFSIADKKDNFVTIEGDVQHPGRFQYDKVKTVKDLITTAGGLWPTAYLTRADLMRTFPDEHLEKIVIDLGKAMAGDPANNITLQKRDNLRIYNIYEINPQKYLSIIGHVKNPGTYPFADSMTIRNMLLSLGGMDDSTYRSQTYLERATLTRLNSDLRTRRSIYFNPGEIIDLQKGNISLEPGDHVKIFSRDEMREPLDSVEVAGMAKRPGTYPLTTNLTLYNLIYDAVGLTDTVFRKKVLLESADLIRLNADGFSTRIVSFNLWNLFQYKKGDTLLLPRDRIVIYPRTAIEDRERVVDIYGSVKNPGRYALSENMTLVDLLIRAQGYTIDAYTVQAEIARVTRTGLGRDSLVHTYFTNLPNLLDTTSLNAEQIEAMRLSSFPLKNRDEVFIRPNPAFVTQQFVTMEGEVLFPGRYASQ